MIVLDVVAVCPTVVLVFEAAVGVSLVLITILVVVGLEGGWVDGGAPLLHGVPYLVLPAGSRDVSVVPV